MAMEHAWVRLEDGSLVRGDQVVGFGPRETREGPVNRNTNYCIEVFGSAASDRFRVVHPIGAYEQNGDFLPHLYSAAREASESNPRLLRAHEDGGNLLWRVENLT